jgi:hypothetical protein
VSIYTGITDSSGDFIFTVDGLNIGRTFIAAGNIRYNVSGIIPAGSTYRVSTATSAQIAGWFELR